MATKAIIYNGDDPNTADAVIPAIEQSGKEAITFGFNENNDYSATNIEFKNEYGSFDLVVKGENLGRITLSVPGLHNICNALAVIAVSPEVV